MTTPPQDLAARPAFLGLLERLRGGEEECPGCEGEGDIPDWQPAGRHGEGYEYRRGCLRCKGSGRVAVPPDLTAAGILSDWWQDDGQGGDLAGLLVVYAGLTEPCRRCAGSVRMNGLPARAACVTCGGSGELPDPALGLVLAAWDDVLCPARAAAVRGLRVYRTNIGPLWWHVVSGDAAAQVAGPFATEPADRLALKRAALACYDPGNPFDGGAGVPIPMRAEGTRLTVRCEGREWETEPAALGRGRMPYDPRYAYFLDGVRVGAPPGWDWTPHKLPCGACGGKGVVGPRRDPLRCQPCRGSGSRLAVTWQCRPSDLLPAAAGEAAER